MQIKFGGIVSDARGSLGGAVFSRNGSGAYVRQRTTPINPKTQRQSDIRAIWASVTKDWDLLLSQAERDAWEVYAANLVESNKLGEDIRHSGFNQYQSANVTSINAGLTAIVDAPGTFVRPGEDLLFEAAISEASQEISIVFDDSLDWVNQSGAAYIVRMGIPKGQGVNFFDGPYRQAGVILGDDTTPPTSPETMAVPYPVVSGQKIFVEAKIMEGDGSISDWFRFTATAGA